MVESIRLSTAGEAYFPLDPADFPAPAPVDITPAQDPTGSYAGEVAWVMGPTPEDAIRELGALVELGVSLVTVYFHDRRTVELFAREVVPAFRSPTPGAAAWHRRLPFGGDHAHR